MITVKLYTSDAEAEDQRSTYNIENIIEDCSVTGYVDDGYMYDGDISC
ncbi:hypothetical protein N9I86_02175 [Hyphomicrobiales bacterium]|nr:hypothetical protein [Hyphomicrobiales bacterium]